MVRARGPRFQGQAGAAGPGCRGQARPGPAPLTNPPPRREIIDDSSIFGQSFNHTPNHNLNHNSNHNPKLWFIYGHRSQLLRWRTFQCQFKEGVSLHLENEGAHMFVISLPAGCALTVLAHPAAAASVSQPVNHPAGGGASSKRAQRRCHQLCDTLRCAVAPA